MFAVEHGGVEPDIITMAKASRRHHAIAHLSGLLKYGSGVS